MQQMGDAKRYLRECDGEELLFYKPFTMTDNRIIRYMTIPEASRRVRVLRRLLFLIVHYKGNRLRDLYLVEERGGNAVPTVVFNFK